MENSSLSGVLSGANLKEMSFAERVEYRKKQREMIESAPIKPRCKPRRAVKSKLEFNPHTVNNKMREKFIDNYEKSELSTVLPLDIFKQVKFLNSYSQYLWANENIGSIDEMNGYWYAYLPAHKKAHLHEGWVAIHTIVMECKIGRSMRGGKTKDDIEVVHHIDHDKKINSPDNLQLMTWLEHGKLHDYKNSTLKRNTTGKFKMGLAMFNEDLNSFYRKKNKAIRKNRKRRRTI